MIKKRSIFLIVVLSIFACLFQSCGGKNAAVAPPQTEPAPPESMERFPEKQTVNIGDHDEKQDKEKQDKEKQDKTLPVEKEQIQENELPPVDTSPELPKKNETIPLIIPTHKPPAITPLKDKIDTGIKGIIREFGYSGEIDIPDNFKKKVAHYIRYFTTDPRGSRFYLRAMGRGSHYLPMIRNVLKSKRLPLSLAYLPIIESGFNPNTRSRAGAVGMWQFMRGTARMYGLKVYRYTDERRDPIKSTKAAAEYLNDLLAMFGAEDPFLGICAYNAGEGKILRALRKISYKERSFWTLVKNNLLRNETDEYIPQFIAVIIMGNNPTDYTALAAGPPDSPDPHTSTQQDADENDREVIASLHAEKIELFSTEDEKNMGNGNGVPDRTETNRQAKPASKKDPAYHKVCRGETLYRIAKNYSVSVNQIKQWNHLRSNNIRVGTKLKIYSSSPSRNANRKNSRYSPGYKLVYTVNYTDSLARIALFFKGVSVKKIMKWNNLRRTRILPKQKLVIYLSQPPKKVIFHRIRPGDTASKIARKYKQRIEFILSLNNLLTNSRLKPGRKIKIYFF